MLQDAVEDFISSLSEQTDDYRGTNLNTVMAYRNDLRQFCGYLAQHGIEDWQQVAQEHIATYLLVMREGQAYRPTTIARKVAALKSFFRHLYRAGVLPVDPGECLETPRVPKQLPQVLNAEQIECLFRQVEGVTPSGLRDLAMLHILCATGMRSSELVSLNLQDFDAGRAVVLCPPRHGRPHSGRALPLSAAAVASTCHYLEEGRSSLARSFDEPALFLNHHGERLTRQGFWLIIKGYARMAGINGITPHVLRHSFALLMLQNGMELRSVQELLGHAHISTTQVYNQLVHGNVGKG